MQERGEDILPKPLINGRTLEEDRVVVNFRRKKEKEEILKEEEKQKLLAIELKMKELDALAKMKEDSS